VSVPQDECDGGHVATGQARRAIGIPVNDTLMKGLVPDDDDGSGVATVRVLA
jgi:hypothetical protein